MNNNDTTVNFTYVRSKTSLTNIITWEDGNVETEPPEYFKKGAAYHQKIEFYGLPEMLDKMEANEAIMSGVLPKELQSHIEDVTTQKDIKESMAACLREDISHENNSANGLIILSIEKPPIGIKFIAPEELHSILCQLIPNFKQVACFSRTLPSSEIDTSTNDYKFYILTNTPSEIPQFIKNFHEQLWVNDSFDCYLGYITIARNGQYLERSIIDLAMKSAHQLDCCGAPNMSYELHKGDSRTTWHGNGRALNCSELSQLTPGKELIYKNRLEIKKKHLKCDYNVVTHYFKEIKCEEFKTVKLAILNKIKDEDPDFLIFDHHINMMDVEFHHEDYTCSLNENIAELHSAFVLHFSDGRSVTVQDVIKDPDEFDGRTLADPVEGLMHSRGTQCAIFYKGTEYPYIHSMANGGYEYTLMAKNLNFVIQKAFEIENEERPCEFCISNPNRMVIQYLNEEYVCDQSLERDIVKTISNVS